MKSNVVVYHQDCYDGFGAAWVCMRYLGKEKTLFIPAKYGDTPPYLEFMDRNVYIVDFSYPKVELEKIFKLAKTLHVLDHHKTSAANLEGLPYCTFDMNRSGAQLAWDYFYVGKVPMLIQYVQDRDLWRWQLPNSPEVNAWLASFERDFDLWDILSETMEQNLIYVVHDGEQIIRFERQKIREICQQAKMMCIDGINTIPVINTNYPFGSLCGAYLNKQHPECKYSAYYFDRVDGEQQWGLRSIGDFDVSEVAKTFGGGGHKNASGFVKGKVTR